MAKSDEHDDDLEPEVIDGSEIETETYDEMDDEEEIAPGPDVTSGSDPAITDQDETDDEASDTI